MPKLTVSLDTDLPLWHRSAEKLIVLLEIHEPQVRQAAREQLVAMGQSVIPAIEEALETASLLSGDESPALGSIDYAKHVLAPAHPLRAWETDDY